MMILNEIFVVRDWVTYAFITSVLATVTETALAVGIACLSRQEQGARKPSMLPVKAYPLAQVSSSCWSNMRTAARLFAVELDAFFLKKWINHRYLEKLYISLHFPHILGNSSQCPPPANAADNTTCVDNGKCHNGECNPFCEAMQNLQSCACNGKEHTSNPCIFKVRISGMLEFQYPQHSLVFHPWNHSCSLNQNVLMLF